MSSRHIKATLLTVAALFFAATLTSCAPKFEGIYFADGDYAASNMLIFSGDAGGLLENGLNAAANTVVAVTMGITEQGTYTIAGDKITFTFGEVTSTATYDKENDAITWYGVTYIKPKPVTTADPYAGLMG
jgi:hypothetical protein